MYLLAHSGKEHNPESGVESETMLQNVTQKCDSYTQSLCTKRSWKRNSIGSVYTEAFRALNRSGGWGFSLLSRVLMDHA